MPLGTMLKVILYAHQVFEFPQDRLRDHEVVDCHEKLDKQTPTRIYYTQSFHFEGNFLFEGNFEKMKET
jgi:hypothetical protein